MARELTEAGFVNYGKYENCPVNVQNYAPKFYPGGFRVSNLVGKTELNFFKLRDEITHIAKQHHSDAAVNVSFVSNRD